MSGESDQGKALAEAISAARERGTRLAIRAGGSKAFLGEPGEGEPLDVRGHRGIVSYEPGELVLTARAGTPLTEIEAALEEAGQTLAFEPPHFGETATLGGTVAAGVSGPARPYTGAARDFVLGVRIVNGRGEILRFGGEVMKNVAGYDLSRLMAGAYGTLGVLLDISLKVLPRPRAQATRVFEHPRETALARFSEWGLKPWPITAAYWEDGRTYLRLAGAETSVKTAAEHLGGEAIEQDAAFWRDVRELKRPAVAGDAPLWRLSMPPAAPPMPLANVRAIDWGGAQRWLISHTDAATIRETAAAHGGHAAVYRGTATPRFHPLPGPVLALHQRLKASMDPDGLLNHGRFYPDF